MSNQIKIVILTAAILGAFASLMVPWQRTNQRAIVETVSSLDGQWVGRAAPPFELPALDGQTHRLTDYRGKVVFLNVWASFCEPCRREMPSMEKLVRQYQERGMVMVAISVDPEAQDAQNFMAQFLPGQRSAMTILHDPTSATAQQYGTELLPETYIIDRNGQIVARFVNEYDWTRPEVKQLIELLLSEQADGTSKRLL